MSNSEKKLRKQNFQFFIFTDLRAKKDPKNHVFGPKINRIKKLEILFPTIFSKSLLDLTFQISRFYLQKQKSLRVFKVLEIQASY